MYNGGIVVNWENILNFLELQDKIFKDESTVVTTEMNFEMV